MTRLQRFAWPCLLSLFILFDAVGAPPGNVPPGFPDVQLPAKSRGKAAVAALGSKLPVVAAFYHLTPQELQHRFEQDNSLWADEYGRLLYVCEWPKEEASAEPAPLISGGGPLAVSPAGYPYEQTFLLHSRPGSTKVIFLDFDGHDASGTSWGTDAIGRPFDLDGDPTTFSNSERDTIQYIWERVSEDYAMFDIDVTTEDPGVEALRKVNPSDTAYGIRVVIGGSSSDWFGSAGGVAYVGSFNWNSDTPCWVWPGSLGNSEKNIAEACSHEAGHTVGLSHDGADVNGVHTEYYGGQGNWAPIMGVSYSKPVSQWSKGEYLNANNTQDDLAVMQTYGPSYRPDDHGNSIVSATALSGVSFSIPGNIERNTDVDFFSFKTGAGRVSIKATPFSRGPNLHILLSLYDSAGNLITSTNVPDNSSGVQPDTITTVLPTGTYYVSVDGVGQNSPLTNGYSDYASLGQYTISGTIPSDSAWLPTLAGTDYSWTNIANWASNTIPIGADAIGRINNNIVGDQTISLDMPITLGRLIVGDADSSHAFTLQDGLGGGPLYFNAFSNTAFIVKTSGASDMIAATLILQTNLVVTNSAINPLIFSGSIAGQSGLAKFGSGNLIVSGLAGYSGSTVIGAGTFSLVPSGFITASPFIDTEANAIFDVTALAGGYLLYAGQTLNGKGTILGDVSVGTAGQIAPGTNGVAGTLTFSNSLVLSDGAQLNVDLGNSETPGGGVNDLIVVGGDLNLAGAIPVRFNFLNGFPVSPGNYTLLTYAGLLNGGASNLVAVNFTNRYAFTFDDSTPGQIKVHISGSPASLVWQGDGVLNRWDVGLATNWFDGSGRAAFYQLDSVTFDDSGTNTPALNLVGTIQPASIAIISSNAYAFAGQGKISGGGSLIKQGSGLLTLSTTNDYTGSTTVNGGTLKIGNASALGATNAGMTVVAGAVLDLNAFSLGAESVTVLGAGAGNGAVINSSATTQTNALRFVTLSGDTTFGGAGRWDVRANPTAVFTGNGFALTKTNANEVWLVNVGASGLGDINVNQGVLGVQGSTTLGNSANTLTLAPNASLAVWFTDNNALNKKLVMNGSGLHSYPGDNIFSGPITLNGSNLITASNIFTLQGAIGGPGSFTKLGSGILALTVSNSFSGTTLVSAGTLQTRNAWALGSTTAGATILTGGRLDISGMNLGAEPITVSGGGLGNGGAIINNGSSQQNALRFVTLAGNTTFGGIGRWDIRANPTATFTGNNFNLTKVGGNEIWMVDAGPSGLGNITVSEGTLGIQGTTTLGNAANNLIVNSGASLAFWGNGTNILSKALSMTSARLFNGNGSNTFIGTVVLSNTPVFEVANSTTLVIGGPISGGGSLTLSNSGTLILTANNTYTNATTILSGLLQVGNGGSTGSLGPANVTNKTLLAFWRTNSFTVANPITGVGGLKHGVVDATNPNFGSVMTLTANNTFTGPISIYGNSNRIALSTDTALGTGTINFYGNLNGSSLTGIQSANGNTRTLSNNLNFGAGGIIQFGAPGTGDLIFNGPSATTDGADKTLIVANTNTTINSTISNSRIFKSGAGTLILGGANLIAAMSINAGTLRIDSETRLGPNPGSFNPTQLSFNGGTLQNSATFAISDSNRGLALGAPGGTFDVVAGTTLTISNAITGAGSLTKSGAGTLVLAAAESYSGATTNSSGTLVVEGTLGGSELMIAGGSLMGHGIITVPVVVQSGAVLSPGGSIGTLSISNTLSLSGTTWIELVASLDTSDLVQGMNAVTYGGTLVLTNVAGTLVAGDSFKIFDAASYGGAFANVVPSTPGPWLAWDLNRLVIDGTVKVISALPQFNAPVISGGNLVLSGSGGQAGDTYYVLTSTNIELPSAQWSVVATNTFDPSGNFSFSVPINASISRSFFRIQTQ